MNTISFMGRLTIFTLTNHFIAELNAGKDMLFGVDIVADTLDDGDEWCSWDARNIAREIVTPPGEYMSVISRRYLCGWE